MIIPDEVIYIFPKNAKQTGDLYGYKREGTPAFPLDTKLKGKRSYDTAINWAKTWRTGWGTQTENKVGKKTIKNVEFEGLTVIDFEWRRDNVVFKVLTDTGFVFDFKFDEFIFSAFREGLEKGGRLNGKFLWARNSSRTFLINAQKHTEILIREVIE